MLIGEYLVRGNEINVSINLRFPGQDLSGQTNSTSQAEHGIKPKSVGVNLSIPYKKAHWLKNLREVAEKTDDNDKRFVYDFVCESAVPMSIQQVKFSDNFFVREDKLLKQWLVTFQLTEYRSTPEKAGERKNGSTAKAQQSKGKTVGDATVEADSQSNANSTNNNTAANGVKPKLTSFEEVLKSMDDWLEEKQSGSE